mgnify:CR=1 FL=1
MSSAESTAIAAPIVDIRALRKSYGANEVLKGIDLQVKPGEVIAIIGKSGAKPVVLVNKSDLFPDQQNREAAEAIRATALMRRLEGGQKRGWGSIRVAATIGDTKCKQPRYTLGKLPGMEKRSFKR